MRVSNVIERPIITEKSMVLQNEDVYIFRVNMRASKGSIANEVKRIYAVDVKNVKTAVMPGKKRRIIGTRRFTKTKKWKKAIVKLADGQKIDLGGK